VEIKVGLTKCNEDFDSQEGSHPKRGQGQLSGNSWDK
jgi:hypothetical protein